MNIWKQDSDVKGHLKARRAASWLVRGIFALGLALFAASFVGCGTTVEACYVHPEFGQVCVKYDGKLHVRADISTDPEKLAAVREWLKGQGVGITE